MKKLLIIVMSLVLTLGIAGLTLADDSKIFTQKISADLAAGYLKLPGYSFSTDNNYPNERVTNYDGGAFFASISSLNLRLYTDINFSDEYSAELVSQFEMYKDEQQNAKIETVSSPIANYSLMYNPGLVKLTFDGMGRDVVMGIEGQELLKLNVARRYVVETHVNGDGDPNIYRYYNDWQAKQLTVDVPLKKGKIVSVFSLEPYQDASKPVHWVGGIGEVTFGTGKYSLGYQAKMTDSGFNNPMPDGYYVLAADYKFNERLRLRLDYSTRDNGGAGYQPWFKPVAELNYYAQTPFLITNQVNSILNINDYELSLRLLNDKYWAGASYYFKPFTVGVDYRNWAFTEEGADAQSDGHVGELYGKYDLTADRKDYLKAFFRTDKSFGACVVVVFE